MTEPFVPSVGPALSGLGSTAATWLPPADGILVGGNQLAGYKTQDIANGAQVYVLSIKASFTFDKNSAAVADQITVVQANGTGRFIRNVAPSAEWQVQTDWVVDDVAGNDENTGRTGSPIKNDAERARRTQGDGIWPIEADTTVFYPSPMPDTNPVIIRYGKGKNGFLRIRGTATTVYVSPPGGLTAVTNLNRAAQTPTTVTEVGLGAGRVNQRIRMTSGAMLGAVAEFAKDLGAGQYRTNPFGKMNLAATPVPFTPTQGNPAPGDTFVVETLSTIARLQIDCEYDIAGGALTANGITATFENVSVTDPAASIAVWPLATVTSQPLTFGCKWHNPFNGAHCVSLIDVGPVHILDIATPAWLGCLINGSRPSVQCPLIVDLDTLCQGVGIRVRLDGVLRAGAVGVFDSGSDGILVDDASAVVRCGPLFGADLVYGNNNTGYGWDIKSGGFVTYNVKPIITGTLNDAIIGGVATAYAAIPVITAANAAGIVVYA